jgi:hypothetical protein
MLRGRPGEHSTRRGGREETGGDLPNSPDSRHAPLRPQPSVRGPGRLSPPAHVRAWSDGASGLGLGADGRSVDALRGDWRDEAHVGQLMYCTRVRQRRGLCLGTQADCAMRHLCEQHLEVRSESEMMQQAYQDMLDEAAERAWRTGPASVR